MGSLLLPGRCTTILPTLLVPSQEILRIDSSAMTSARSATTMAFILLTKIQTQLLITVSEVLISILCSSVPISLFAGNTGVVPNYTSYGPRATRQMLLMILTHPYSKVCLKMHLPGREEIFSW